MAEYTQNYNLKKPAEEDFYNVKDFNDNADIVDEELKAVNDKVDSHLAENMPHLMQVNNKIYQYGFKQENGFVKFIYKEVE